MDQYSPKSSPRQVGSRSPNVTAQQVDATGLKMTISLKQKTPFYLLKSEQTPVNDTTGATNLMAARGLEHSYHKLTTKKMKDSLSSFLPHLPGIVDTPGSQDNSSLRGLYEKPPVGGKELAPLSQLLLSGFRLHPGPLPEQYRGLTQVHSRRRHKHKKHRRGGSGLGLAGSGDGDVGMSFEGGATPGGGGGGSGSGAPEVAGSRGDDEKERRREKKHKRHEKDADERKKKKKEKKRKKNREDKDM